MSAENLTHWGTEGSSLLEEPLPEGHKSGFVALVGKPNVGKSTLLNHWLGTKIAAVSPKPQTTRTRLLGILTREDAQIIFVDTPGIHRPRTELGNYMVETARQAVPDSDVVLLMVDASVPPSDEDREVAHLVSRYKDIPAILVLNKIDLVSSDDLATRRASYEALGTFTVTALISATMGQGTTELLDQVIALLPEGPRFYPPDQLTDQPERFIAAELVREQIMLQLRQEVPHAIAVLVHEFQERENGVLYIAANIYTERESQKRIVIGAGGQMLKRIGAAARQTLEDFFGKKVYLDLWVKVRKGWRKNKAYLKQLGYQ